MVSAGSTGATQAAAVLDIGRVEGVRRPVVAARIPLHRRPGAPEGQVLLLDAGGSADADAEMLLCAARLGAAHVRALGVDHPRIGLLSVGVEDGKGSRAIRAAGPLLRTVEGFVGNVEPSGMLAGTVDVVVTDGFTGNLVLKTIEAMAPRHPDADSAAVILGVRGTVLVAHGDAGGAELAAAVRMAMAITPPAVTAPGGGGGAAGTADDDSRGTGR
jgi:glycerol-3-phosphate acyltransferase PlsX